MHVCKLFLVYCRSTTYITQKDIYIACMFQQHLFLFTNMNYWTLPAVSALFPPGSVSSHSKWPHWMEWRVLLLNQPTGLYMMSSCPSLQLMLVHSPLRYKLQPLCSSLTISNAPLPPSFPAHFWLGHSPFPSCWLLHVLHPLKWNSSRKAHAHPSAVTRMALSFS